MVRHRIPHLISLVVLVSAVHSKPFLREPNQGCPDRNVDAICPITCVKHVGQCTGLANATCPLGTVFCPDGRCRPGATVQESCFGVVNPCDCGSGKYVACLRVDAIVPQSLILDTIAVNAICSTLTTPTDPTANCSTTTTTTAKMSASTPFYVRTVDTIKCAFVTIIAFTGIYAIAFAVWMIYRSNRVPSEGSRSGFSDISVLTIPSTPGVHVPESRRRQKGYCDSRVGKLLGCVLVAITLALVGVGVAICLHYYTLVDLEEHQVEVSFDALNVLFIVNWHIVFGWLFAVNLLQHHIGNLFRLPCPMTQATIVRLWFPNDDVQITDGNRIVKLARDCRHWLWNHLPLLGDGVTVNLPVLLTESGQRYIEFHFERYSYNADRDQWEVIRFGSDDVMTYAQLSANIANGLPRQTVDRLLDLEGPNSIHFEVPGYAASIVAEFCGLAYLYQICCLSVSFYMSYWGMATIHLTVIVVSGLVKAVMVCQARRRCQAMARHEAISHVLRDGQWQTRSAHDLVTGDIVSLHNVKIVPFDGVLLSGSAVFDESSLTGESVAKPKWPIDHVDGASSIYDKRGRGAKHTIFSGTTLLQQKASGNGPFGAIAVVVDKGSHTAKGALLRSVLFPKQIAFTFDSELEVVFAVLLLWSAIAFIVSMVLLGTTISSWFYGLFTLGNVILPILPAFLVVGQSVSAKRLKRCGIHCRDLNRIVAAGKIRLFAFDKTGTITQSGLNFHSVHPIIDRAFQDPVERGASGNNAISQGMACAHTISFLNSGDAVGSNVDLEMFAASGWAMEQSQSDGHMIVSNGAEAFDILRTLEFESQLMRMCSVARERQTGKVIVFLKGSFESMESLAAPDSVPGNFRAIANSHARQGFYTMALAYRELGQLSDREVSLMNRADIEAAPTLSGLILFQNTARSDSAMAIDLLKSADIRTMILTGDNAFTACHTAIQIGMISEHSDVVFGEIADGATNISWLDLRTNSIVPESLVLQTIQSNGPIGRRCELAISGRAFRHLVESGQIRSYLFHTRVLARLTPEDKTDAIGLLQEKVVVGMCGDGGNDCGALQKAHAGLALSDGDASIASPFSSGSRSIMSCIDLISYGRAALSTNLSLYKFAVIYGETMLWAEFIAYSLHVVLPIMVWAFIDGPVLIGMAHVISLSQPAWRLASRRPTARLFGPETLSAVIGTIFIDFWFIVFGLIWLYNQPFMKCNQFNDDGIDMFEWWKLQDNAETEVISILAMFQCLFAGALMTLGSDHRRPWYRNRIGVVVTVALGAFLTGVVVSDPNWIGCAMRINCGNADDLRADGYMAPSTTWGRFYGHTGHNVLPDDFRIGLMAYVFLNALCLAVFHGGVVQGPVRRYVRARYGPGRRRFRLLN